MDIQMDNKIDFQCKVCNKGYSSYKSLWNHNKKFHSNNSVINSNNSVINSNIDNKYSCRYCNKMFSMRQYKWSHEKTCTQKDQIITISKNELDNLKKQLIDDTQLKLDEKNKELENTINEMKKQFALILKEKGKIHHKTLQKINNQLNNTINSNNSNNNINHGNIINNTFVKFGELKYQKVLNNSQIKQILNKQYQSLEESIKQIHFNEELPEYSNIFITNMKDDLAYIFNGKQFISVRKNEMIHELIDIHTKEINLSLEKNKNKLNEKYVNRLEKFLDMLNDLDDVQNIYHDAEL